MRARTLTLVTASVTLILGGVGSPLAPAGANPTKTRSFEEPGEYTFVVPGGVNSVSIEACGAPGGTGGVYPDKDLDMGDGGLGAHLTASLAVSRRELLTVRVGGPGGNAMEFSAGVGGFNGGGIGGGHPHDVVFHGGGGGGASDLQRGSERLVVAAGGGGGGGSSRSDDGTDGGHGGAIGTRGQNGDGAEGGEPGGLGGRGGRGSSIGTDAAGGNGGNGGFPISGHGGGGGGGGGLVGGGGGAGGVDGAGGGGGGGSSLAPNGSVTTGACTDSYVRLTYEPGLGRLASIPPEGPPDITD